MNRGLRYLLRVEVRAAARQMRRRLSGVKGILVAVAILLFLFLMIGPQLVEYLSSGRREVDVESIAEIRAWAPLVVLAFVFLGGLSARSLYFKPAEIAFLFPAPISRRELVVFVVLSRLKPIFLSSLWMMLFFVRHAPLPYAGAVAILLVMVFLQLSNQCAGLLFSAIGERLGRRMKWLAFLLAVGALGGALFWAGARLPPGAALLEAVHRVRESAVMDTLAWTTRPFVEVFLASSPAAFALWAGVSALILVALLAVIVLSDVAFTESSLAASRRVEARLRRLRAGGGAFAGGRQGSPRVRLPALPRAGGAGALAWRQGVELLRNLRSVLLMAVLTVLFPVLPAFLASASANSPEGAGHLQGELARSAPFFAVIFLTTLLTQYAFFDFRRDLDRMGYLKSLPVSAVAVAAGQLTASTCLLFVLQCIAVAALVAFVSAPPPALLAASILALLPLDWLAVAIDNALFLQFPYRPLPKETGQMPFVGRMMLVFALKGTILSIVLGAGVLVALLVHTLTGSVLLGGVFAAVLFVVICLPATLLVAFAFRRFDVSRDIPS